LIRNADALVVAIPTLVFVMMLPGLLYFELAFDVQKSMFFELLLCLLPSCGAALILRLICGAEAMNVGVTWGYVTSVSDTPLYFYFLVLLFDVVLYTWIAWIVCELPHRKQKETTHNDASTLLPSSSPSSSAMVIHFLYLFNGLTLISLFFRTI